MEKIVLVSGAGTGIGRAIAIRLARSKYQIILLGRNHEVLHSVIKELDASGGHCVIQADTRDATAVRNGLKKCNISHLDAIIANAGIGGENTYGENDRWDDIISTNLTGTYILVNEAIPYLKKQTGPHRNIVLISSILARLGVPNYTAYCASKAGLLGLMRSWASEMASERILVNALSPGWVSTDMANAGIQGFAEVMGKTFEEAYAEQMSFVPLGKMSMPEEIANLVHFLVSDAQSSITGQVLDINNGALMPS